MVKAISGDQGNYPTPKIESSSRSKDTKKEPYLETALTIKEKGLLSIAPAKSGKIKTSVSANPDKIPSQEKTNAYGKSRFVQRGMREKSAKTAAVSQKTIGKFSLAAKKRLPIENKPAGKLVPLKLLKKAIGR